MKKIVSFFATVLLAVTASSTSIMYNTPTAQASSWKKTAPKAIRGGWRTKMTKSGPKGFWRYQCLIIRKNNFEWINTNYGTTDHSSQAKFRTIKAGHSYQIKEKKYSDTLYYTIVKVGKNKVRIYDKNKSINSVGYPNTVYYHFSGKMSSTSLYPYK